KVLEDHNLPFLYKFTDKPEIAEELRKHKYNLELNQDKLDAKQIVNFNYKDKEELFVDVFPEQVRVIEEIKKDIQELVEQRTQEINNREIILRRKNVKYNQAEYDEVLTLKTRNNEKMEFAVTDKTIRDKKK
ncbi:MAG: hypothetical protein IIB06_09405, partial [Bacteroidetes bacterium]|nr:hypothetical protein [Bacteroidota bacterium]